MYSTDFGSEKKVGKPNKLKKTKNDITVSHPVPPKLYILPKVHKLNNNNNILKGRPVVSCVGSALYNLSSYLTNILTLSFESKCVKEQCEKLVNFC
jgi:hypothetical protein